MTCPLEPGDKIRLDHMGDDPNPVPDGTTGTVRSVSQGFSKGNYHVLVDWDIGRSLALLWPVDQVTVIKKVDA